jgi:hypothetical protein
MALGKVGNIFALHLDLKRTTGSNIRDAATKRNSVNENGLIIPASFSDAKNDPATRVVASNTRKWCLIFPNFRN